MTPLAASEGTDRFAGARVALADASVAAARAAADRRDSSHLLLTISVPIPDASPSGWFHAGRAAGEDVLLWWQPTQGQWLVGIGTAASITVDGPERFLRAADRWREMLTARLDVGPAAGRSGAGPVLLGGATFAEGASSDTCWAGFEQGRLDVPALMVRHLHGATILNATLLLNGGDAVAELRTVSQRFARILEGWPDGSGPGSARPAPVLRQVAGRPRRDEWSSWVGRSAGAVGRGRIDKVVLARRVDLQASDAIDAASVFERLSAAAEWDASAPVTVFGVGRAGRTFLGASPERLVEVHGRAFRTVALAGTASRGADPTADAGLATALLASEKDREEHEVVVEMLRDTLAPISSRLDIDRSPHVMRLPTVQHLATGLSGELRDDLGILDLVQRLHPTPAVGGWPRAAALDLLHEQEHLDRGWYAGPIGWLDAHGDGEFVVAIRSGVIEGDQASLFVGCGIVGDSEPEREWAESGMKLLALASAIGHLDAPDGAIP